ncbi:ABC transporter ATP-binding protein [Leucobacter luti]|uniref:ABC transporter ATP-binding protein n=1 Tax=Leucobacter luti TaxID=340320 RepID=UPI00104FED2D|nr:ABC transporter ATP-binding protein [Leucobacter luti]MCW2287188.1 branched-chain amino acid transport system ATP-binding protein [Leucobacter luti]QYM76727.1 ABC transporter ATP-binding protein [Leucobacter luti]TCK41414.1 branched-chain amino acid transport system ATP-binding protein [Leucobacter luti]
MSSLNLENVELYYNRVHALRDLSIEVREGEIVSLLGNNGAGKTSTLSLISGLVRAKSGTITWGGKNLAKLQPWDIVGAGLIHIPEGRRIFSTLSVHENLLLGGYLVKDQKLIAERAAHAYELMPRLAERREQQGGTLSGGEQQMLALGRALVGGPQLLLLDEPSMGLAPLIVKQVMDIIRAVNSEGTTVLLVEQNARAALKIADRAYVLESGRVTMAGPAAELAADPRVIEAYLGA